jgi:hypothetical protein
MGDATLDIFRGVFGSGTEMWVEAVPGLENARKRMEQIAGRSPGLYFIFNASSHVVVACINTRSVAFPSSAPDPTPKQKIA